MCVIVEIIVFRFSDISLYFLCVVELSPLVSTFDEILPLLPDMKCVCVYIVQPAKLTVLVLFLVCVRFSPGEEGWSEPAQAAGEC